MIEIKLTNLNSSEMHILADAIGAMENLRNPETECKAPQGEVEPEKVETPKAQAKVATKQKEAPKQAPKESAKDEPKQDEPKEVAKETTHTLASLRDLMATKINKQDESPEANATRAKNTKAIRVYFNSVGAKNLPTLAAEHHDAFVELLNELENV